MSGNDCSTLFIKNIDQCIINYDNIIVMGDLNFDMLNDKKCQALKDLCDVLDFSQLVLKPTCFMKNGIPSLVDVVLTNQKNQYFNIQNVPTGISDCHSIISVTIKGDIPVQKRKIITYRSYTNFDTDSFNCDLEKISFPDIENLSTSSEVHNVYNEYQNRQPCKNPLPCMNSELRGAIYRKHMFYSQYTKNRNTKTWEKFRKQRNLVTKLKKNSMKTYFLERCTGGAKNVNFWKTVKPFFSKKM